MNMPHDQAQALPWVFQLVYDNYIATVPDTERTAAGFLAYARDYLSNHRPVQMFPADGNMGFQLTNNLSALLCPATDAGQGGTMQDAGAVPMTHGYSQPGQEGVSSTKGQKII